MLAVLLRGCRHGGSELAQACLQLALKLVQGCDLAVPGLDQLVEFVVLLVNQGAIVITGLLGGVVTIAVGCVQLLLGLLLGPARLRELAFVLLAERAKAVDVAVGSADISLLGSCRT